MSLFSGCFLQCYKKSKRYDSGNGILQDCSKTANQMAPISELIKKYEYIERDGSPQQQQIANKHRNWVQECLEDYDACILNEFEESNPETSFKNCVCPDIHGNFRPLIKELGKDRCRKMTLFEYGSLVTSHNRMYQSEVAILNRFGFRNRLAGAISFKKFNASAMSKRPSDEDPFTTVKKVCTCSSDKCNTDDLGITTTTTSTSSTQRREEDRSPMTDNAMNLASSSNKLLNMMAFIVIIYRSI